MTLTTTRRCFQNGLILLAVLACAAGTCLAQVDTGVITGTLTDATGAVLPDVSVLITNTATGIPTKAVTTAHGQYVSPPLRPGPYTVAVEAPGFRRTVTELTLSLNDRAVADMVLQVGTASEQVTVKAEAPLLESESATVSNVQDQQAFQDVPMNVRNVNQLIGLMAGVVPGDTQSNSVALTAVRGETQNTVNGLTYRSNRFLVDGIDNSEPQRARHHDVSACGRDHGVPRGHQFGERRIRARRRRVH